MALKKKLTKMRIEKKEGIEMVYTIKNTELEVKVKKMGAELTSIKKGDKEYLWQGDEAFWNRQAPLLFPIVGELEKGTIKIDGVECKLSRHGFVRDCEFELIEQTDETLKLSLKSNEETLKNYPFDFEIIAEYKLDGKNLETNFYIKNNDNKKMVYNFGLHPAFNCNTEEGEEFTDFYLEFEKEVRVDPFLYNPEGRVFPNKTRRILEDSTRLNLRHMYFDNAVIVSRPEFNGLSLGHKDRGTLLNCNFSDFHIFAMWQPKNAPFLCFEPWSGFNGFCDEGENLEDNKTEQYLEPATEKVYTMNIEII